MAKQVTFRAYWQLFSDVTINLPDEIDPDDEDAVREYCHDQWEKMSLPEDAEYLYDSDEIDDEHGFEVTDKKD